MNILQGSENRIAPFTEWNESQLLNYENDPRFDRITRLAQQVFTVSFALD